MTGQDRVVAFADVTPDWDVTPEWLVRTEPEPVIDAVRRFVSGPA
jgi:hypothetical protein